MKGITRVVLIDPNEPTRQSLSQSLGEVGTIWLVEVCTSYRSMDQVIQASDPDLVLVVVDHQPDAAIEAIGRVVQQNPKTLILPAGQGCDGGLILNLVRAGAREYLPLPAPTEEVVKVIDRMTSLNSSLQANGHGLSVIAVTGSAGGVGTTTVAVNLAVELAKDGSRSVLLIDFDLLLGCVDTCLDIIPEHTLLEVVQNIDQLDLALLKRSLIRHKSGLYILPHPIALEDAAKIDPEALRHMLSRLKATFDTIIVDTSKGLQATDFAAFEMAEVILLVVQLDLNCLRNSVRLLQLYRQLEDMGDRVRIVVNRTGSGCPEISIRKAEETLECKIGWQIPEAWKIFNTARCRGVPIQDEARGSKAHRAIVEIATDLIPDRVLDPEPSASARSSAKGLLAAFR